MNELIKFLPGYRLIDGDELNKNFEFIQDQIDFINSEISEIENIITNNLEYVIPNIATLAISIVPSSINKIKISGYYSTTGEGGAYWISTNIPFGPGIRPSVGRSWILSEQVIFTEMLGATGNNVLVDGPAIKESVQFQKTNNKAICFVGDRNYKMGNTRLWKDPISSTNDFGSNVRFFSSNGKDFNLDYTDATTWTGGAFQARVVITGTPDVANAQALLVDLLALPPIRAATATYDAISGLITMTTGGPHGYLDGSYVNISQPSSSTPGQIAYLTMKVSNEGRSLSIPVQINVLNATTFTYPPPNGGTPDPTYVGATNISVISNSKFVKVSDTSQFNGSEPLIELRAENTWVDPSGDVTKPGATRIITQIIDSNWMQISEPVLPDMPFLVANTAKAVLIPDAPIVSIQGMRIIGKGYNPGGIADCGFFTLFCKNVYIEGGGPSACDFAGFASFSTYRTIYNKVIGYTDKRNEGGAATGSIPLQYGQGYGGSCTSVKFIDCEMNGGRHGMVEWSSIASLPYGRTEDIDIIRPRCDDQWSNNISTHSRISGRLNIIDAVINNGLGINPRRGNGRIQIKAARNTYNALIGFELCSNLIIDVDYFENIQGDVVRLVPYNFYTNSANNIEISIHAGQFARRLLSVEPQQGVKGINFHLKKIAGTDLQIGAISFSGFSVSDATTWTKVKIDYVNVERWGIVSGQTLISLINCPNSSVETVRSRRSDSLAQVLVSLSGMTCDKLYASPDIQGISDGGGLVTKVFASGGTGHWALGCVEEENCTVVSNTITPRYLHDHLLYIPPGTYPLTISGVNRGSFMLRATTGNVILQQNVNLRLSGGTDKTITSAIPLPVSWIGGTQFCQSAQQIT